jgi:undecaprenyl-diphosphatase
MSLLQSIILGIVQGLTEFLPISSSAHLVIVPYILGWHISEQSAFVFDVLVQLGTLLAVFAYFWNDLVQIILAFLKGLWQRKPFQDEYARLGWFLILATIPAGILGLLIKDQVEKAFSSPLATGFFLLLTAALLVIAERVGKRQRDLKATTWVDALWMGIFQSIAIFPGVSRSGATISGGMNRNLDRISAARFSFLMSVPVLLAAGLLATKDLLNTPNLGSLVPPILAGFVSAAIVGYLSIRWLLAYLTHRPLYIFAIYCLVVGILIILLSSAGFRTALLPGNLLAF